MTLTEQAIATIAAGCEGVTEGPWGYEENGLGTADILVSRKTGRRNRPIALVAPREHDEDAAHIARLDPATVLALCALAQEALQSRREGQQMREATIEECAKVAQDFATQFESETDAAFFAMFVRRESRLLSEMLRAVATAIRALSHPKPESVK